MSQKSVQSSVDTTRLMNVYLEVAEWFEKCGWGPLTDYWLDNAIALRAKADGIEVVSRDGFLLWVSRGDCRWHLKKFEEQHYV